MTQIAFIVNGPHESAMGERARAFARCLEHRYDIRIIYRSDRKFLSLLRFLVFLLRNRPALSYVFDMAYSGVISALLYKSVARNAVVIDTGDCISALARSMGNRGAIGLRLTDYLENLSLRSADHMVVRGSFHRELLKERNITAELIRDGVDTAQFAPCDVSDLRRQIGLDGVLTVGMVGTSIWSDKLQMCYGWELVETIRLLRDKPVKGILIGHGSGIARLQQQCHDYGIEDKVLFLGFVPYERLSRRLSMIDVCLSTQTNDVAGKVRTTGKLPLYLAAGRHILASRVGEAAIVLENEMLVDYDGVKDLSYPSRLAERIRHLIDRAIPFPPSATHMALARNQFDYSVLSGHVAAVIERTLRDSPRQHSEIVAE